MEWLFNYSLLTSPLHSVARFDLSWGDPDYHQEILENLKAAVKTTKKLYVVMLDTVGAELQINNGKLLLKFSPSILMDYLRSNLVLYDALKSLKGSEARRHHFYWSTPLLAMKLLLYGWSSMPDFFPFWEFKTKLISSRCRIHGMQKMYAIKSPFFFFTAKQARGYLSKLGDLCQTQTLAKIENIEGLIHFDEILQEADGIILSRREFGHRSPTREG
ncbi:hypothetical protein Peur_071210 [Populus x canadensis]